MLGNNYLTWLLNCLICIQNSGAITITTFVYYSNLASKATSQEQFLILQIFLTGDTVAQVNYVYPTVLSCITLVLLIEVVLLVFSERCGGCS